MNLVLGLAIGLSFSALSITASAAGETSPAKPIESLHGLKLTFIAGSLHSQCKLTAPEQCVNSADVHVSKGLQHWTQVRVDENRRRNEILQSRIEEATEISKVLSSCAVPDSLASRAQTPEVEVACKSAWAALAKNEEQQQYSREELVKIAVDSVLFDAKQFKYPSPTGYGINIITDSRQSIGQDFTVPVNVQGGTTDDSRRMFSAGATIVYVSDRNPMEIVASSIEETVVGKCKSGPGARYLLGRKIPYSDRTLITCVFPNGAGSYQFAVR